MLHTFGPLKNILFHLRFFIHNKYIKIKSLCQENNAKIVNKITKYDECNIMTNFLVSAS